MTDQLEIPQTLTIASALGKRRVRLSTLRPGDWIYWNNGTLKGCVMINSAKLNRLVIRWSHGEEESNEYSLISCDPLHRYMGHGILRRWLPKFLHSYVSPYAPPTRK